MRGAVWWRVVEKQAIETLIKMRKRRRRRLGDGKGVENEGTKNLANGAEAKMWRKGRRG